MKKINMEEKMEQILKDEKEKLLSEINEAILKRKSMMRDTNKFYLRSKNQQANIKVK